MTALEKREYDQNVSALRAQVTPEALASAWAVGRAQGTDQAVAFALG